MHEEGGHKQCSNCSGGMQSTVVPLTTSVAWKGGRYSGMAAGFGAAATTAGTKSLLSSPGHALQLLLTRMQGCILLLANMSTKWYTGDCGPESWVRGGKQHMCCHRPDETGTPAGHGTLGIPPKSSDYWLTVPIQS